MKNKVLLGIAIFTIFMICLILIFSIYPHYQKYVLSSSGWIQIMNSREESSDLLIDNIYFNDYSL